MAIAVSTDTVTVVKYLNRRSYLITIEAPSDGIPHIMMKRELETRENGVRMKADPLKDIRRNLADVINETIPMPGGMPGTIPVGLLAYAIAAFADKWDQQDIDRAAAQAVALAAMTAARTAAQASASAAQASATAANASVAAANASVAQSTEYGLTLAQGYRDQAKVEAATALTASAAAQAASSSAASAITVAAAEADQATAQTQQVVAATAAANAASDAASAATAAASEDPGASSP